MLALLKPAGELAIILPAAFVNGQPYVEFRRWLFVAVQVRKVIQLPAAAFTGADVQAFVFIGRKPPSATSRRGVELIDASVAGERPRRILVNLSAAIGRCDAAFHLRPTEVLTELTLAGLGASLQRGRPVATLSQLARSFFHTTHFANLNARGDFKAPRTCQHTDLPTAMAGDFLLGRIGRNCYRQIARVTGGATAFSDCVFRLQVAEPWQPAVFDSLTCAAGIQWRRARQRGSGAALLSKADLLQHPVWIAERSKR